MKKIIAAVLLTAGTTTAFAQSDDRRKGFIGISLGAPIPVGEFSSPDPKESDGGAGGGLHINLINFGYRFSDKVGIAGKYFSGANVLKVNNIVDNNYKPWAYGGMLIGPMVAIPLSEKVELDFRPMFGFSVAQLPVHKNAGVTINSNGGFAYSLGTNVQFNVASRFGIHAMLDYFHTKATFKIAGESFSQNISTITPSVGFVYRFN